MQNLIVLCHRCYAWVETHSETCPECAAEVCLETPDADRDALSEILGRPFAVLGPLRIERHFLPSFGYFIGTTNGLLFLPRLHRRVNGAWEAVTSQRLPQWWPFHGDQSSPRFLSWLKRPFNNATQDEQKASESLPQDFESPVDQLMDSPGAFFTEHRMIRSITSRRRLIKLNRTPLRSVSIIDETDDGSLCLSLNSLVAQAAKEKLRPAQ